MARYVLITDVVQRMAEHCPPAWAKLALIGALSSHRIRLWSATGSLRAYLPPYNLWDEAEGKGILPPRLLRVGESPSDLIERYGLKPSELPNTKDVDVWEETWTEPMFIASGWHTFAEPWDWDSPVLAYEGFEIPRDYELLFGYDDLHPEGEPDLALTYEARFDRLCIEISDAENLAPMISWDAVAFGSKTNSPMRSIGRPKGSGFQSADEPIVAKMLSDWRADRSQSALSLAEKYVDEAAGHGTRESKVKRLQRRLRLYGV